MIVDQFIHRFIMSPFVPRLKWYMMDTRRSKEWSNDLNLDYFALFVTMLCYTKVMIRGSFPILILLQCNRKKPKQNEKQHCLNFYNLLNPNPLALGQPTVDNLIPDPAKSWICTMLLLTRFPSSHPMLCTHIILSFKNAGLDKTKKVWEFDSIIPILPIFIWVLPQVLPSMEHSH